ncbi:hypothetical protein [Lacibacter sp. H407]|uniref:hypothetical protein n=1 Tax=Lacibacter sp. H407 TaxID=3133423 RepID=UPI0030C64E53
MTQESGSKLTISIAREWFNNIYQQGNSSIGLKNQKKEFSHIEVVWDKSHAFEDDEFWVVESPLLESTVHYLKFRNDDFHESEPRLLILKDKKKGNIFCIKMNIQSNTTSEYNQGFYKNVPKDFSGSVFFSSLKNQIICGWEYKNGGTTRQIKPIGKKVNSRIDDPNNDCITYIVDTYERTCFDNYCSEWTLVNSQEVNTCPNSGGSGGAFEDVDEIILNNFKENFEMIATAKDIVSTTISVNDTLRVKRYKWIAAEAATIVAQSSEIGHHRRSGPNVSNWTWKSLAHERVQVLGIIIGGSVSITNDIGYPTIGTYNSAMSLAFTTNYSCIIPNKSPISWSMEYNTTAYININD